MGPLSATRQAGKANFDGKVGSTGNSAKNGSIDVRVLLDKSGGAVLEIRTGTFDDATNTGTPNGYFQNVQYKVYDGSKKQVQVENVKFKTDGTTKYVTSINLCSTNEDEEYDDHNHDHDHDHDRDHNHENRTPSCAKTFGAGWTVSVQANLKGVGGDDKKTDVVRVDGTPVYLPDVDLTKQGIYVVGADGSQSPASQVTPGVATTYSVTIPNNKPVLGLPNSVGVVTTCAVSVDGITQFALPTSGFGKSSNPNLFSYVGSGTQTIAGGASAPCQFTLTLSAGKHTVKVTAVVLYPGDYDSLNNSTQAITVTAVSGSPDIAAGVLQADIGNGQVQTLDKTIYAGQSLNLDQWVSLVSGAPPGTVTCTLTITNTATNAVTTASGSVALTSGDAKACAIPYSFAAAGTYSVTSVVMPPSGVTDPVLANNTATNTVTVSVAVASANVVVSSLAFTDAAVNATTQVFSPSSNPAADTIHSGDVVTYAATVSASNFLNATSVPSVTCTATDNGTDITKSVTWIKQAVASLGTSAQSCSFQYTITESDVNSSHPHTIGVSVSTGNFTNTATTNATGTGTVTIPAVSPQAAVVVSQLSFTDAAEHITSRAFSPTADPTADTVHSGDVARYEATISATGFRNATAVPVTCSATVDGVSVTSGWVTQTISLGTTPQVCSFTRAITETDNLMHPHNIQFFVTTGTFVNTAKPADTSRLGVINDYRRVDVSVGALQLLNASGNPIDLSKNGVQQGATVTLQVPITNLDPTTATSVNCGILSNDTGAPITTFALPSADIVASSLRPVTLTTTAITLAANGTGVCQYSVTAPTDQGLISIPLVALVTSTTDSPPDPDPRNNASFGSLTVVSSGAFTNVAGGVFSLAQEWTNPFTPASDWPVVGTLDNQNFKASQLSLLVVPTKNILGTFALSGTVISGPATAPVTFGTGTLPAAELRASTGPGDTPCITIGPLAPLGNAGEPEIKYFAQVCATQAPQDGFQAIFVNYSQSMQGPLAPTPTTLFFTNSVVMKIRLDFTLTGSTIADKVTATITVPVITLADNCGPNQGGTANACSTTFGAPTVSTP